MHCLTLSHNLQPVPNEAMHEAGLPQGQSLVFGARETIYHEVDEVRHVYRLVQGAVMLYQILSDGRRQVVDLIAPGEFFGLGDGTLQDCSAETLVPTRLAFWDERVAASSPALSRALTVSLGAKLARMHDHATLLGRKTATERVASFLMRFVPECGGRICAGAPPVGYERVPRVLAMSRQEIGDYLGLTLETVSRTLNDLKRRGLIAFVKRDVILIKDICRLCRLASLH